MQKAATTEELKNAFENHLAQTEKHVSRLENIFTQLGEEAQAKKCEAMEGITREGDTIIHETKEGTLTRDTGLIMAAQKVEHYEIATYGSLIQLAHTMGLENVADILHQTLEEEKAADNLLTEIAKTDVNQNAQMEGTHL